MFSTYEKLITSPPIGGGRGIVMPMSVCLFVCVCVCVFVRVFAKFHQRHRFVRKLSEDGVCLLCDEVLLPWNKITQDKPSLIIEAPPPPQAPK